MPVEVLYIPEEHLPTVWENYSKAHLSKVIEQAPGFTLESLYSSLQTQRMQLWLVLMDALPVASFTTCIQDYPERRELECVHLGGERMQEWGEQASTVLTEFGRSNKCSTLITCGRKGTERLYKQWGFELESVRMYRNIV